MAEFSACPVPHQQRPLEEYRQLNESWFFAWPSQTQDQLNQALLISWLLVLPLCLLIASGSWALRDDPLRLIMAGAVASLV
ncbi:MAG: CGLD27 family protein, partial [Prochlorococcus sp.]